MKRKVYSKLLALAALGFAAGAVPAVVSMQKSNDTVAVKAADVEVVKPYATFTCMVGAWNPYQTTNIYLLEFQETLGANQDSTNLLDSLGQYVLVGGNPLNALEGTQISYSNGAKYLRFDIPSQYLGDQVVVEFLGGFEFQDYTIPHIKLVSNASFNLTPIAVEYPETKYYGDLGSFTGMSWDNKDYFNPSIMDMSNGYGFLAAFEKTILNTNNCTSNNGQHIVPNTESVYSHVFAGNTPFKDIPGSMIGSYANFLLVYAPKEAFGVNYPVIKIDNEAYVYNKKLPNTSFKYILGLGSFGGWKEIKFNYIDVDPTEFNSKLINGTWPAFKFDGASYAAGAIVDDTEIRKLNFYENIKIRLANTSEFISAKAYLSDKILMEGYNGDNSLLGLYFDAGFANAITATNVEEMLIPAGTELPAPAFATDKQTVYRLKSDIRALNYENHLYWVKETVQNKIVSLSNFKSFDESGFKKTNLNFDFAINDYTATSNIPYALNAFDSFATHVKFYDKNDTLLPVSKSNYVVSFGNYLGTTDLLLQFKTDLINDVAKVVIEEGMMIPSTESVNDKTLSKWWSFPAQTLYVNGNKLVEKTTVKFGDNDPVDYFVGDTLGTLPTVPAHDADPEGKITYTGYWKDADGNRVSSDTVVNGAMVLSAGYDESDTIYTITYKDGENVLSTSSSAHSAEVTLPELPTKTGHNATWVSEDVEINGNTFVMPVKNVVINVKWSDHVYGDPVYTWNEDKCTATKTCPCGDAISEEGTVTYAVTKDPTCTEAGVGTYTATFATLGSSTKEVEIPAINHDWNDATYSWSGDQCTAKRICKNNPEHIETETVTASFVEDIAATCEGNQSGHYEATFQNTAFEKQVTEANSVTIENSAKGHDWGNPTYSRSGGKFTATRVCKNDPTHIETETVDQVYVMDTEADCTHNETGHYEGTFKNPAFEKQVTETSSVTIENSAKGHDWGEVTYTWNDNECTATRVCKTDSDHVETETVTASFVEDTAATCEGNQTGHYEATFQNTAFEKQVTEANSVIIENSAKGHDWGKVTYTWNDDECTATRVCANDANHVETETVTGSFVEDTAATCEANQTGHYEATFQNTAFEKQVTEANSVIIENSAKGHDWGKVTYTWNDDECTATRVCANDPSHVETETVKGTYVKDVDATCVANEKGHFEVEFVNEAFEAQETAWATFDVEGTATGHHYGEVEYSFDEETHIATATINCVENDSTISEEVEAVYVKDTDATIEANEKGHWEATFVDERLGSYATEANSYEVPDSKLPEEKKGCGGSVVAASAVVTGLALAGVALVAGKKKED